RVSELTTLGATLDERGRVLLARMDAAEARFSGLEAHAAEAERLTQTTETVSSHLRESHRRAEEIKKTVTAITARCASVEGLAERSQTLRKEIEQRQGAVAEAGKDLERAAALREQSAASAQTL